jgi:hypothetical protein
MPFALTVPNGTTFDRLDVVLTGTAPAGSKVEVVVHSKEQVGMVVANSQGKWSWTPPELLDPGDHSYYARLVLGANSYGNSLPAVHFKVTGSFMDMPSTGAALVITALSGIGLIAAGFGNRYVNNRRSPRRSGMKHPHDIPVPPILLE